MAATKKILYISYDGMTDPLGQSQVLPYLTGLSKFGYLFTILSFEKKDRYIVLKNEIEKTCSGAGITWVPMSFTRTPPIISKFYDAVRMRLKAYSLYRKHKYQMIHCRSYLAADIGLSLKRKKKAKFFFDMRGFWADEKKDAGTWNQNHFLFRRIYRYYKKKEEQFISEADYIISLTDAGKNEIMKWPSYNPRVPLSVIPCCSDMDHFTLTTSQDKITSRQALGLPEDKLIISYLGSVGSWYMLDEMLELVSYIKKKYPGTIFLFITHSEPKIILSKLAKYTLAERDVMIIGATRQQVPVFAKASDVNISFIRPDYSKISSSPTKLGEVLAMGIPVIANAGVGDIESIINKTGSGIILKNFNQAEYLRAVEAIPELLRKDHAAIRNKAEDIYSLDTGITEYKKCYERVLGDL
jgi:glycosyltransferase involved in cell wall biosynthesis